MNAPAYIVHHNKSQQTSQTERLSPGHKDRSHNTTDQSPFWTSSFRHDSEQCGEGISSVMWEGERRNQAESSNNAKTNKDLIVSPGGINIFRLETLDSECL